MKKKFLAKIYIGAISAVFLAALSFFYLSKDLPSIEEISNRRINQSTKIYDRTGSVLLYEISSGQERTLVPLDEIPKYLKDATVDIEDEKFYSEPAFDWQAIIRALLVDLSHGRILQGGSTITQQLAKNAFLTPEQTISRKIKEFILATKLNKNYSKDKILELYLNEIPYGSTAYGIESASETFFNKSAKNLNLSESALLASLAKAPTYYSPWGNHYKELRVRQKFVLEKMLNSGKITKTEFEKAVSFKITFAPQGRGIRAPHFVMSIQNYLVDKYGEDIVRKGGLRVMTTLDWDLQQAAEKAVSAGAKQNEELYQGKNAALAAENPQTGEVLALVGSRYYFDVKNEGNFDVATQGLRQPGSALKPFAYLTAFAKGYTPDTVIFDTPTEFTSNNPDCPPQPDFKNDDPKCFHPENFSGQFTGPVSMRQALAQSINIPSVKTLYLAGLKDTVKNAYSFGLTTLTSADLYGLSLVLGGGAVKLIDLVNGYSVLAQDGVRHKQTMILEIKDSSGNILEKYKDASERVFDSQAVRLINNILSDAEARSGLFHNSLYLTVFPDRDIALKTGTSNDYRDAWAIGYTPSLAVGVWAGNNDNSPMQKRGSSILAAVPIWHDFMAEALKNQPAETFNKPDPVITQKPILNGDYLANKQIHSILYYVDRSDPLGPQPENPANDPQFANWEYGVLAWAKNNMPDFSDYNQLAQPQNNSGYDQKISALPPKIEVISPAPGEFAETEINVYAKITSETAITDIKIYWNKAALKEFSDNFGNNYELRWPLRISGAAPQNLLEVEAKNQGGSSDSASVIVYGR